MTHPTDEELDALVERLKKGAIQVAQDLDNRDIDDAAAAITTIRTQLAEVKQLYEICKEQLHYASRRADRAEADLQAMTLLKEKAEKALNALANQTNPDKER